MNFDLYFFHLFQSRLMVKSVEKGPHTKRKIKLGIQRFAELEPEQFRPYLALRTFSSLVNLSTKPN